AKVSAFLATVWTATTPLCAFNAAFDLTMLDAELQRHHGCRLLLTGPVIDPLCIDRHLDPHRAGARNLGAVCTHYQVRLDKAHNSADDAIAAARLAWRLAKTQPARVGLVAPQILHSHQASWYRDRELAYADKLDLRIRRLSAQVSDTDEVARLRARAATARASAQSWPLLSVTTADSQPVKPKILPSQEILRRVSNHETLRRESAQELRRHASAERITIIVRGLPCKCRLCGYDDVSVAVLHSEYGTSLAKIVQVNEDLALTYARELLQYARHPQAGTIKMRRSINGRETYMSNGCVRCDALLGRFFDLDDLTSVLLDDAVGTLPVLAKVERPAVEWHALMVLSWTTGSLGREPSEEWRDTGTR
ncbi:MAG: hypothetical protein ACRDS9_23645, partial [Pseudonocardiaceae bacterium]